MNCIAGFRNWVRCIHRRFSSEIFLAWTMHFTYEYAGSDSLDIYRKDRIPVDLSETVRTYREKKQFRSKLYYDTGAGLSEENSIETTVELNRGRFQVTFDLHNVENIRGIRWNLLNSAGFSRCATKRSSRSSGTIPASRAQYAPMLLTRLSTSPLQRS